MLKSLLLRMWSQGCGGLTVLADGAHRRGQHSPPCAAQGPAANHVSCGQVRVYGSENISVSHIGGGHSLSSGQGHGHRPVKPENTRGSGFPSAACQAVVWATAWLVTVDHKTMDTNEARFWPVENVRAAPYASSLAKPSQQHSGLTGEEQSKQQSKWPRVFRAIFVIEIKPSLSEGQTVYCSERNQTRLWLEMPLGKATGASGLSGGKTLRLPFCHFMPTAVPCLRPQSQPSKGEWGNDRSFRPLVRLKYIVIICMFHTQTFSAYWPGHWNQQFYCLC